MLSCKSSGRTSCTLAHCATHIFMFSHVVRFAYNVVNFLAFLWYFLVFLSTRSSLNSTRFIYMNKNNIWAVSVACKRDKKKSFNLENVSIWSVHANRRRKIDDILGRLLLAEWLQHVFLIISACNVCPAFYDHFLKIMHSSLYLKKFIMHRI